MRKKDIVLMNAYLFVTYLFALLGLFHIPILSLLGVNYFQNRNFLMLGLSFLIYVIFVIPFIICFIKFYSKCLKDAENKLKVKELLVYVVIFVLILILMLFIVCLV